MPSRKLKSRLSAVAVWLAAAAMAGSLPACSYLPKAENKVSANTGEVKSTATIKTSTPERHLEPGRY